MGSRGSGCPTLQLQWHIVWPVWRWWWFTWGLTAALICGEAACCCCSCCCCRSICRWAGVRDFPCCSCIPGAGWRARGRWGVCETLMGIWWVSEGLLITERPASSSFTWCHLSDQRASLCLHRAQSGRNYRRCCHWGNGSNTLACCYGDYFCRSSRDSSLLSVDQLGSRCTGRLEQQQ